jgi:predicted dithiol-disulfide oxidoreductase (DUF899 family)
VILEPLNDARFPGETDEYRAARNELLEEEIALRCRITALARRFMWVPESPTTDINTLRATPARP